MARLARDYEIAYRATLRPWRRASLEAWSLRDLAAKIIDGVRRSDDEMIDRLAG